MILAGCYPRRLLAPFGASSVEASRPLLLLLLGRRRHLGATASRLVSAAAAAEAASCVALRWNLCEDDADADDRDT